jgi:D-sedoheptulose 7-phosphate isomerase
MRLAADVELLVGERILDSIAAKQALLQDTDMLGMIADVGCCMAECLRGSGTVFFFGNGGSAADAQHLAAELTGRFLRERAPLPGVALTTNTSCLTAIANDYGYDAVFSRQIQALGTRGDVAVGISTSGSSKNVLQAFEAARANGMTTVGLTGLKGRSISPFVDYCLWVETDSTPRIQELHIMIGHILCEIVEGVLFADASRSLLNGNGNA